MKDEIEKKNKLKKKIKSTKDNSINLQPEIWDQNNFIEKKTEKITKLKAQ
jgi:hypothetical protein